jgi:hypothetical protein
LFFRSYAAEERSVKKGLENNYGVFNKWIKGIQRKLKKSRGKPYKR